MLANVCKTVYFHFGTLISKPDTRSMQILQCPVWYPETWIIGSITGYNIFILHFLFVLNIFIAGFGMYKLSFYFNKQKIESLIVGIIYMLSGFFVSHGQHFFVLIAAAYIPFVIYFYLKLLDNLTTFNLCKLLVFTYFLISGGYQMLTIITAYLLVIILAFYLIRNYNNKTKLISIIKYQILFLIAIILLCSPILISIVQISGFTSRFREGLTLSQIQKFAFSPQSFISLVFPFATTVNGDFFNTDISMRNVYIGIPGLIFFILAMLRKKKSIEWVFLGFGLFCLMASLGNYLPVRKFLAEFFPLMNQFKAPSYFTVFFIIAILISISIHLPDIIHSFIRDKRKPVFILIGIFAIILIINVFFYFRSGTNLVSELLGKDKAPGLTIFDKIFIQTLIQIVILSIFLIFIIKIKNQHFLKRFILLLLFADLFISVNLNSYYTTFLNYPPYYLHQDISKFPKGFPIPYHEKIAETTDKSMSEFPLWRNIGNFQKRISFNAFTSLVFDNYNILSDSLPALKDSILSNYLIYISDKVFPCDSLTNKHVLSSKDIFTGPDDYNKIKSFTFQVSKDDTIGIEKFNPNSIQIFAENHNSVVLTLLQEYYTGWNLFIDGKKSKIFISNNLYMSAVLTPGKHIIEFKYKNNIVLISSIITALALLIMLIYLINSYFIVRSINLLFPFAGFILLSAAIFLFCLRTLRHDNCDSLYDKFNHKLIQTANTITVDSLKIIINSDRKIDSLEQNYSAKYMRFKFDPDYNNLNKYISSGPEPYLIYGDFNSYNPDEVRYYIMDYYPCITDEFKIKKNHITVFRKDNNCIKTKYKMIVENGFENSSDLWNANPFNLDTTVVYNGKYSYRLDSLVEYSPTYYGNLRDPEIKNSDHITIDISAHIFMTEGSVPFIVFERHSPIMSNIWKASKISKHNNGNNKWTLVHSSIDVPAGHGYSDKFKIYIWNNSKSKVYIDNFKIRFK